MSSKPEASPAEAAEEDESAGDFASIESLVAQADVEGLLELARAHRAGAEGVPRDLLQCFRCYDEAAKLGSASAEYSAALFHLSGGIVPKDQKLGAMRLRTAADAGYAPAKVYLANLYELGIHYKADTEKANVWYRNAARSSGIDEEPGTPEFVRAMAELGCVRYCLVLVEDPATSEADRAHFNRKAKAFGYRDPGGPEGRLSPTPPDVSAQAPSVEAKTNEAQPAPAKSEVDRDLRTARVSERAGTKEPAPAKKEEKAKPPSLPLDWSLGAYAFLYAVVFMGGALAGGHALHEGARVLLEDGKPIPLVGARLELVRPIVFGVVGVLPMLLAYRLDTLARALVVSGVGAVVGEILWSTHTELLPVHATQVLGFAAAGLLAALLVLGIAGGTRSSKRPRFKRR